ncbi:MAG: AAA family ATPase, partial [Candidatus Competibacteraceae bacterium]|nr:AAA family ATPase [Candidatus Competibacteraceae bacterium]
MCLLTTIATLQVQDFRNLRSLTLECSPGLNLIVGENGCGKTSLLEALYYLGRARSFRTHQVRELIYHQAEAFRLVATTETGQRRVTVGIERSLREQTVRIAG